MRIQDVNQLLAIMKANYSYAFKAMSPDERYMLLGTWAVTLQDLPADVVMLAVMQLVSQSKWMGKTALHRLADIEQGELIKFVRPDGLPPRFANRDKLYWKDGPNEVGTIGVWQWNAIPKPADPSSDYVLTYFDQDRQAIEIVEFDDCSSLEDVAEKLTNAYHV